MMGMNLHSSRPRSLRRALAAVGAVALVSLAAGCGDDDETTDTAGDTTPAGTEIAFAGQWARTSPAMASMGAAYVTITSPVDDKLLSASVDASIAATVEVHETYMIEPGTETTDMGMGSETTMAMGSETTTAMGGGEMGMRPVEFVELPAGVAVELKPGGYHIMLIDLVAPLEVGTTLALTLVFENAGSITIDVPVLDEAP